MRERERLEREKARISEMEKRLKETSEDVSSGEGVERRDAPQRRVASPCRGRARALRSAPAKYKYFTYISDT